MAKAKLKTALEEVVETINPAPTVAEIAASEPAAPVAAAPVALVPAPSPVPAPVQTALRPAILGKDFGLAEFRRRKWRATLSENQTFTDAADSVFWRYQAELIMGQDKQGGRGDIIEVWKADTSEFAELIIVEIGKGYIKTKLLRAVDADPVSLPEGCPFEIKWNASRKANDVVRKGDNAVMSGGHQSKQSAANWILNHLKAMAA